MDNRFTSRFLVLAATIVLALGLAACSSPLSSTPKATQTTKVASAPAPSTAAGQTIAVYVGPKLVDCVGVAPQKCLQVKSKPDAEYQLFYSPIEGFNYEPGYEYQIRVKVTPVANPPADAPAYRYSLVDVVSKTPSAAAAGPTVAAPGKSLALGSPTTISAAKTPTVKVSAATATPQPPAALDNTPWKLVSYVDSKGKTETVLPDSTLTAAFSVGKLDGNGGCNTFFGTYQASGNKLTIKVGGSTKMACPAAVMTQESAYFAALDKSATYKIAGDQLTIADAKGTTILTYTVLKPASLVGGNWQVMTYNNGRSAMASALAGSNITLAFGPDGNASGTTGCNTYSVPYQVSGNKLTFGPAPAVTTRMMCSQPAGIMDQETAYLAALSKTAAYAIQGNKLTLTDAQGSKTVEASAAK